MSKQFTAVFEQVGEWWIGYVEELPGANTQGRTLEETRANLREAIRLILETRQTQHFKQATHSAEEERFLIVGHS